MNTYAQRYNLQLELPSFGTVGNTRTLQKPVFSTSSSSSSHIDNQRDLSNQVLGRKNDHFGIINNRGLSRWMADEAIGNPNKLTVSSIDWWDSFEKSMFIAGKYIWVMFVEISRKILITDTSVKWIPRLGVAKHQILGKPFFKNYYSRDTFRDFLRSTHLRQGLNPEKI